ncbi:MAG: YetF domain-containing protein [Candidatus Angelobacter sp.]
MFTSWHTALEIVLRTAAVYVLVLVGIRLTGKREVGQMTPFDLTLLLLLSNSVQNAMTGPDTSLVGGGVAALVLLTMNFLLAELSGMNRRFRKMIQGSPTLLIHNGECITSHMAKEHISMDELNRALREHGVSCTGEAALAVLEVDGSISVLKYDDVREQARPHKRLKFLNRH